MRKFLHSPLFRCLICLFLISCILVNCSPLRADAFGAGAAVTAIVGAAAAVSVVAGVMMALGVMPDSANTAAFETVVNGCTSALTSSGVFLNGLVTVLQLSDGVVTRNHVNEGIVQAILDWLFSSGTVSVDKSAAPDGYKYYNGVLAPEFPAEYVDQYPVQMIIKQNSSYYGYCVTDKLYVSSKPTVFYKGPGLYSYLSPYDKTWGEWYSISSGEKYRSNFSLIWSNVDWYDSDSGGNLVLSASEASQFLLDITIATGLIAGQIGTDIETDYETWVQDGVVAVDFGIGYVDDPNTENDDDDDDEGDTEIGPSNPKDPVTPENPAQPSTSPSPWWKNNKWLNVGGGIVGAALGELTYQYLNQTQNGIQTGSGDPAQKVDTSLFANNGNGTNNWLDPDPSVPEPTTPVVPPVSSDIAGYTFDLKDIFPFCIPFDIYNFLKCLDAPPEAPVINWELYVPGGGAYPLIIDLSVFDEVAELLRRLELLLFCVGLAFKTRDLIKG